MGIITNAISSALGLSGVTGWQWREHINPASFRGVPFGVINGDGEFGRRVAVHEYPYKEIVYVEDLGKSTRKFSIKGFLVQDSKVYDAPDVFTQRDNLIAAVEEIGGGTLVHPTLGELIVFIPDGGLKITEGVESERVFEFTLTCIEGSDKLFAVSLGASAGASENWLKTKVTAALRFVAKVNGEINSVAYAISTIKSTIDGYSKIAQGAISSVTNLGSVLESTFGNTRYSRYNNGAVGGSVTGTKGVTSREKDTNNAPALVDEKIASSVMGRQTTLDSIADTKEISSIEEIPQKIERIIDSIVDSTGSVKEKITVFETLSKGVTAAHQKSGVDQRLVQTTLAMLTCMSASSMAYIALQYTPSNLHEAQDILSRVCNALESAMLFCADQGDDDCYRVLLDMRNAFVKTYTHNFAALSDLISIKLVAPLPSLTLANRFYQDAGRSMELIQAANPIHPAFMPPTFKARKQ